MYASTTTTTADVLKTVAIYTAIGVGIVFVPGFLCVLILKKALDKTLPEPIKWRDMLRRKKVKTT